jgi:hypothetical protein
MAKLEIKRIEDTDGLTMRDYHILIDGHEPTYLLGLELSIGIEQFNQATITFNVDDLQVDGDFLTLLKAKVDEKECSQ